MRSKDLAAFISAREAVRVAKEAGLPRPWTDDPILGLYRFCNVHREDDRVSKWLRRNWYPHFVESADYWFAAVVARLLNSPDSLKAVRDFIVPWNPKLFMKVLQERKAAGLKNFNAAYIVSTNGLAMDKVEYITYNVLSLLWAERKVLRPKLGDALDVYHGILMSFDGLGSFLAAQVVGDLKYMEPLRSAPDWHTFAASGPGSRRGLNRVMGREPNAPWRETAWRATLATLLESPDIKPFELHAQDLQNCLCEFDKYERARLGEGTPKQVYKEKSNGEA